MSEQEIQANDLVQYVGPNADMYATYGRVHTVHTFGLSGPVADTLFAGQTGMDAVPVKFLHKVPANPTPEAPQDHGPLAAQLSDRTLDKVLSRPAHVPSIVLLDRDAAARNLAALASEALDALRIAGPWTTAGGGPAIDERLAEALDDYRAAVQS